MATVKNDEYIQSMSYQDLQKKFKETLRDVDMYELRFEQSSNLLGLLEAELIKRAVGELAKQVN